LSFFFFFFTFVTGPQRSLSLELSATLEQGFLTSMQEAEMENREIETREAQVLCGVIGIVLL